MSVDVVKACRVKSHVELADHDPGSTFGWSKKAARAELADVLTDIAGLQERLFAGKSAALLVVLQAIDAGGKDGTIREVFRSLNPAGIDVESFGVPSEEERSHDYLWRIHQRVPAKGRIGIFNRSHYEDVLVVRVKGFAPEHVWRRRFNHIRDFERMLCDEGTHVVKLYLNVSKEEQRARLQDRVDDPTERWKFRRGDLDDRALWADYQVAFEEALRETTRPKAPWYVVPGDHKWVRNLVVARIVQHHLIEIDPQYPPAEDGVEGIVVE